MLAHDDKPAPAKRRQCCCVMFRNDMGWFHKLCAG
jgi:hypothetical protein